MITLYHGGPSGHSASVLIALAEKGLAFDDRPIDLAAFEQHDAAFLAINPAGQVPVLEEDGRRLTEAFFILLYLDERYADPPLGGPDPKARYIAQKWGKYVATHVAPNLSVLAWAAHGRAPDAATQAGFARLTPERRALWQKACAGFAESEVETARAAVDKALGRMAEDLAPGPWLAGSAYGVADIAVFPHIARARDLGFGMPAPVAGWLDRMSARPSVRAVMGERNADRLIATMGPERGRWG